LSWAKPHDQQEHADRSPTVPLVAVATALITFVVFMWLFAGKIWRAEGRFAAPLTTGLSSAQRRRVDRALRDGTPSPNPVLAAVELDAARRSVSGRAATILLFGLFTAGALTMALAPGRTRGRPDLLPRGGDSDRRRRGCAAPNEPSGTSPRPTYALQVRSGTVHSWSLVDG